MAEAKPKTKLTYRDYCKTPDDERWELLNGELVMAPSANTAHQMICIRLASLLHTFVLGEVWVKLLSLPTMSYSRKQTSCSPIYSSSQLTAKTS